MIVRKIRVGCVCRGVRKIVLFWLLFEKTLQPYFRRNFLLLNEWTHSNVKEARSIRQINQTPKKDDICGIFYGRFGRICCAIAASDFMYILHTCMLPM